jgi:hypothetical protein
MMKNITFILLFFISINSYSQNKISFFGGLNYSPPTSEFFNEFYGEASFGFHFGAGYSIAINNKWFFNPKVMYSQQGDRKRTEDQGIYTISRTDTNLDFINIPLNLKYGEKTYLLAGPQIGILINDKIYGDYYSDIKSNFDYGINLGFGSYIIDSFFMELNVFKGFATFLEYPATSYWDGDTKIQSFYAQLSIGYTLN